MSENPQGRRTRRARRVSIDTFDAMRAGHSGRAVLPEDEVQAPPLIEQEAFTDLGTSNGVAEHGNDLEVPFEAQYAGKDFLAAPGLRRVALGLIMRDQHLRTLTDVRIEYLWKRRGGQTRGVPKIGDCVMPSGLAKHAWNAMARALTGSASEQVTFVVWLASDHLGEFTPLQVEASLYRQMLKATGTDARDHSKRKLKAPDLVCFYAEVLRYGLWSAPLVQAAPVFSEAQAHAPSQGNAGDDPWGADAHMETTLNHTPVETTGEGRDA